jgi:hypothetical protein
MMMKSVDVHRHLRQAGVHLERALLTHVWWHRVFATVLGAIETDACLAFRAFAPGGSSVTRREFRNRLALQLIRGDRGDGRGARRAARAGRQPDAEQGDAGEGVAVAHVVQPLRAHASMRGRRGTTSRAQLACVVCHMGGSRCCVTCSTGPHPVVLCSPSLRMACYAQHAPA